MKEKLSVFILIIINVECTKHYCNVNIEVNIHINSAQNTTTLLFKCT